MLPLKPLGSTSEPWDKLVSYPEPRCPYARGEQDDSADLRGLWDDEMTCHGKSLAWRRAQGELRDVSYCHCYSFWGLRGPRPNLELSLRAVGCCSAFYGA